MGSRPDPKPRDTFLSFSPRPPHRGRRGIKEIAAKPLPLKATGGFLPPTSMLGAETEPEQTAAGA